MTAKTPFVFVVDLNIYILCLARRHGTWLEEKNIEIPGGVISGPDLSLENRDFLVLVTINNFDKVRTN